jgi:hypothetical protein
MLAVCILSHTTVPDGELIGTVTVGAEAVFPVGADPVYSVTTKLPVLKFHPAMDTHKLEKLWAPVNGIIIAKPSVAPMP